MGVNGDLRHWFRGLRDAAAEVVLTLWTVVVEVFGHIMTLAYFDGLSRYQSAANWVTKLFNRS